MNPNDNPLKLGTGAIHVIDERDFPYLAGGAIPEVLPTSYQTPKLPALMQGFRESCVSHAAVRALQFYWRQKTGKIIDFSPRFLHAYTSAGMAPDAGRDPRQIFATLKNIGCCTQALLPNDVSLDDATYSYAPITQVMLQEAAQYKLPDTANYSFVPIDQYSLRHAIYHKGCVALLFPIGAEWYTPDWLPEHINPLRRPAVVTGQHEVVGEHWGAIEGIENSWSDQWDELGYAAYNLSNYTPLQAICIDDATVDFNPSTPTSFKFLKDMQFGQTNSDIVQLQKRLNVVPTSGYFGPITRKAVLQYQSAHGIPATAYVGILTRTSLNNS